MIKSNLLKSALIASGLLLASGAQAIPTLIGDTVDVELTGGISLSDSGILVDNSVELQGGDASTNFGAFLFPMEFIDLQATSIVMSSGAFHR